MIFVFYPADSPEPSEVIYYPDAVYIPVNADHTLPKAVTMSKGDKMYVIHDQSPMTKLLKSFSTKPNKLERSQLRGNW